MLNDPHSKIVDHPKDLESIMIVNIFNTTQYKYGMNGLEGFEYQALKDNIKWKGLKPSYYLPIVSNCMSKFLKGVNKSKI